MSRTGAGQLEAQTNEVLADLKAIKWRVSFIGLMVLVIAILTVSALAPPYLALFR
jgi:hypothetical protein